ncbi:MAG: SH3 domain-containing protein [Lachnospiraceae bacterium]|nr:SH3 domain-containing protein [Lachnospiraceae bacterium]
MKKRLRVSIILMLAVIICSLAGCGSTSQENNPSENTADNVSEETADNVSEETADNAAEEAAPGSDENTSRDESAEGDESNEESGAEDAAEDAEDEDVEDRDPVGTLLDSYMNDPEKKHLEYVMYDVNADGIEEIIFTDKGRIKEIYGMRNNKPNLTIDCPESLDMTLYPKGMLRAQSNEKSDYGTKDMWMQYFPKWGDFLSVFEELNKEYYTFCAYNLSDEEIRQINSSIADINDYPVWLYEWSDNISKKDFERLVPKDSPVKLPESSSLSDREAIEVIPEYLEYVGAPDGYANLRTGPGTEYDIICRIPNDDSMEVYRKKATSADGKTWLKVTYYTEADNEDGYDWLTGWIAESQLQE